MTGKNKPPAERKSSPPGDTAPAASPGPTMRERAEAALRETAARLQEDFEALTPEEMRQTLHELRVHQIELEMQNEELRRTQLELDLARAHYFDLYDLAPVGYCTLSETGQILQANLTAATLLGVSRGVMIKHRISQFLLSEDQDSYYLLRKRLSETGEPQECELRMVKEDGAQFWAHLMATAAQDNGGTPEFRIMLTDITEHKQLEAQVHHMAFYDSLTKLPNRRLLDDRVSQAMAVSRRSGCYGALIFLDLDNFKLLNDTHGHGVGDLLLIEAADRLKFCVRDTDTVARFGGDEFAVVLSGLNVDSSESTIEARIIAEKIRAALATPFALKIQHAGKEETIVEHLCTVSIGVALFDKDETRRDNILKSADIAMYQAKGTGSNLIQFYDASA